MQANIHTDNNKTNTLQHHILPLGGASWNGSDWVLGGYNVNKYLNL